MHRNFSNKANQEKCVVYLVILIKRFLSIIEITAAVASVGDEDLDDLVGGLQVDRQPRGVLVVSDAARSLLHVTVRPSVHSVRCTVVLKLRALPGRLVLGEVFKC